MGHARIPSDAAVPQAGATLPVPVGLESMTLDLSEETSVLPALLVAAEANDPDTQQSYSYLCLSSDNRYNSVRSPNVFLLHYSSLA